MTDRFAVARHDYRGTELSPDDIGPDPISAIAQWVRFAGDQGEPQPNAMCLATVDAAGEPSARTVLLKGVDTGLLFFTNYNSAKGAALAATGIAAVNLTWLNIHRQIRASGPVEKVTAAESDEYFASRPRGAQIAAAASDQSSPLADRADLERRVAAIDAAHQATIPRPTHWGGYRLIPDRIEFWQGRENRMHDRFEFRRSGSGWVVQRLAP